MSAAFTAQDRTAIERAIRERRSVRAFLPEPVAQKTVEDLLDIAARAPSGTNMQPWRAHVLAGEAKRALTQAIMAAQSTPPDKADYQYYPEPFFEPYLSRRRKVGFDMYGLLGIAKGDKAAMLAQGAKNFDFFGAPVGIIFTIDRNLAIGSWLDYGYFLEALSIAVRAQGLDSCSQAAFASCAVPIRAALGLSDQDIVICGFALGYRDPDARINQLETERVQAAEFATFQGF